MIKRFLFLFIVLFNLTISAFTQENIKGVRVITAENTPSLINRALIAGISQYANIDNLQFAHSDALSFYNFLRSPAGGNVDTSNIILLLNEQATSANFFAGLDWLLTETKEGETVAIYFSGHGDLETKTIRQNGFLLGYDSPKACYMAGAIGIGYVQDYLATLVTTNKAKVIMISDACRSGKLAGGMEGLKNTTTALAEQWESITKILSSQAGELSMESTKWGGGAGVFTYYLIRGLSGLADRNGDNMVNLLELNIYLNDNIPRETNFNQNPTVDGKQNTIIAYIDSLTLLALQKQSGNESGQLVASGSRGFIEDMKEQLEPDVYETYQKFQKLINQGELVNNYLKTDTLNAYYYYEKLISDARAEKIHSRIQRTFLAALQNKTQLYLNNYVRGKDLSDTIDLFQAYLEQKKALEMVDSSFILYNNIKSRYLFLECLCMRDDMQSLKLLEECIQSEPEAAYAYNEMGSIYIGFKQYDKAQEAFETAIKLAPNWSYPYNNLGTAYYKKKQFDKSKEYYRMAMEKDSSSPSPYYNLGILYTYIGDTVRAVQYYNQAILMDTAYKDAYLNLAAIFISQKKYYEAEKKYLQCAHNANPAEGYYYLGYMYFVLEDYDAAEKYYLEALHFNSVDEKVLVGLGELYNTTNRYEESIEYCHKALEVNPEYGPAYKGLGNIYFRTGEYREALDNYYRALQYDSLSKYTLYYIGNTYLFMNNRDSALLFLNKVLKQDPEYTTAWYRKGDVYATFMEYDSAEYCFAKVIELDPENEDIYSSMGNLKFINNDCRSAIYFYEKAVQINPEYENVLYPLGICYELLGDMLKAIPCFLKCTELSPGNYNYLASLAYAYMITGKYDESKDLFLKSIEIAPDVALNYYNMACLYSLKGMNQEGLEWLEKAFEKGFDNFEYLQADPNMENVRAMEGFMELVKKYR